MSENYSLSIKNDVFHAFIVLTTSTALWLRVCALKTDSLEADIDSITSFVLRSSVFLNSVSLLCEVEDITNCLGSL